MGSVVFLGGGAYITAFGTAGDGGDGGDGEDDGVGGDVGALVVVVSGGGAPVDTAIHIIRRAVITRKTRSVCTPILLRTKIYN